MTFHSADCIFWCTNVFKFWWLKFWSPNHLPFLLCYVSFWGHIQQIIAKSKVMKFCPWLFSQKLYSCSCTEIPDPLWANFCLWCKIKVQFGFFFCLWIKEWQPTPVFLPGESHGQRSLTGYSPWGCKESDTTELLTHPVPQHHSVKILSFPHSMVWHSCCKSFDLVPEGLFLGSLFVSMSAFRPVPHCFDFCSSVVSFEIRVCETSNLVTLFQDCFGSSAPLEIP